MSGKKRTREQILRRKLRGVLNPLVFNGITDFLAKDKIVETVIVAVLEVESKDGGS